MLLDGNSSLSLFGRRCAAGRACVLTLPIEGLQIEHCFCVRTDGELRMKRDIENVLLTL